MNKKILSKFLAIATGAVMLAGAFTAGVSTPVVQVQAASTSVTQAIRNNFDPVFYSNKYADLKAAFGNDTNALWNHFQQHGMTEGRMMNVNFDPKAYLIAYQDVADYCKGDYRKAYEHYVMHGQAEGRKLTTGDAINQQWVSEAKAEENKNNNNNNNDNNDEHKCRFGCINPWNCGHNWGWYATGFNPNPWGCEPWGCEPWGCEPWGCEPDWAWHPTGFNPDPFPGCGPGFGPGFVPLFAPGF